MNNVPLNANVAATQAKLNHGEFYADSQRLNSMSNAKNTPENIKKAAKEFESIFIQMMLSAARKANESMKSDMFSTNNIEQFTEIYDKQLAMQISQSHGGIGLADSIIDQLIPKNISHAAKAQPQTDKGLVIDKSRLNQLQKTSPALPLKIDEFKSPEDFVKKLMPIAQQEADKLNLDPKLLLAQAALETGWGKSTPKSSNGKDSHNLFGIKANAAWRGSQVNSNTKEYYHGKSNTQEANFRAYPNHAASIYDYVQFIGNNPRYQNASKVAKNPEQYAKELQKAGYATDPNYATNILRVYNKVQELI